MEFVAEDSKNRVYTGLNGNFPVIPTTTVPSQAGAPGTASGGLLAVLIGDLLVLEPSPYKKDRRTETRPVRREVSQRDGAVPAKMAA